MLSKLQDEIVHTHASKVVVIAAAAAGKAQPDYTLIPTPNGLKRLDHLKVGDQVFTREGKTEEVLQIFPQGEQEIYEVEFSDGRIVECCEQHLWSYDNGHNGFTTKTLKEMYQKGWIKKDNRNHNAYKYRVPNLTQPVEFKEKALSIPPYVVGCFIGDGCCLESSLTLSSSDEELIGEIATQLHGKYYKLSSYNYSWSFISSNGKIIKTAELFHKYEDNLCCPCLQKTIPEDYLYASIEQRFELLQGLMDTDGTTGDGKNSPSYSTNNLKLAEQVADLARSLGFCSRIFTFNRADKKNKEYSVNIFTGNREAYKIFRLSRKRQRALSFINISQRTNHHFITIHDIRKTERFTLMRCILVDHPEHLYLTNNYVVTHNTQVLTERVRYLLENGAEPSRMVVITFTNAAADEMKKRVNIEGAFIGTIHSYANYLLRSSGHNTSTLLENEEFDMLFSLIQANLSCIRPVDHLLLDEAQDSGELQMKFLLEMIQPKNYFLVGDFRQSIYEFNGARPDLFYDLANRDDIKTYHLNENYRNGYTILNFARSIIDKLGADYVDDSIAMSQELGKVYTVEYSLPTVLACIKKFDSPRDWFVLVRTNAQLDTIYRYLTKNGIPCDTFKRAELSNEDFEQKMAEDTVKVLTVHTAKGLEANNVIVVGVNNWKEEEIRVEYVAATRAKKILIWTKPAKKKAPAKKWGWG